MAPSSSSLVPLLELDNSSLCDASWDAFGDVTRLASRGDEVASNCASRIMEAMGPRDYSMLLHSFVSSAEQREWEWLVRELCRCLEKMRGRPLLRCAVDATTLALTTAKSDQTSSSAALVLLAARLTSRPETAMCGTAYILKLARWDGFAGNPAELVELAARAGYDLDFLLGHLQRFRNRRRRRARYRREALKKYKVGKAEYDRRRRYYNKVEDEEDYDDMSESADSASSSENDEEPTGDEAESEEDDPTVGFLRNCPNRFSATGCARLVSRLAKAGATPKVWSLENRDAHFGHHAARLLARSSSRKGSDGCASDGAFLALVSAKRAPEAIRDKLARRALRIATNDPNPKTRSFAKRALHAVVAHSSQQQHKIAMLRDLVASSPNEPGGCVVDLVSATVGEGGPLEEAVVSNVLSRRLDKLLDDGKKGYDSLQGDLDGHLGGLGLARRLLLFRNARDLFPSAIACLRDRSQKLGELADTLRRRLRRPQLATWEPAAGDEIILAEDSPAPSHGEDGDFFEKFASNTPPPFQANEQSRYLLNLVAENLDYILQHPILEQRD